MGFIKVPLFVKLLFSTSQKFSRLVLWEAMLILELHSAETQGIGQTPQNFGKKLKRDTVTLEELKLIADVMEVTFE